jgi:hypothetical protein
VELQASQSLCRGLPFCKNNYGCARNCPSENQSRENDEDWEGLEFELFMTTFISKPFYKNKAFKLPFSYYLLFYRLEDCLPVFVDTVLLNSQLLRTTY